MQYLKALMDYLKDISDLISNNFDIKNNNNNKKINDNIKTVLNNCNTILEIVTKYKKDYSVIATMENKTKSVQDKINEGSHKLISNILKKLTPLSGVDDISDNNKADDNTKYLTFIKRVNPGIETYESTGQFKFFYWVEWLNSYVNKLITEVSAIVKTYTGVIDESIGIINARQKKIVIKNRKDTATLTEEQINKLNENEINEQDKTKIAQNYYTKLQDVLNILKVDSYKKIIRINTILEEKNNNNRHRYVDK